MWSALYVGAGCDTRPLFARLDQPIVCVDGQPFSEFGTKTCSCYDARHNCFSRPKFPHALDRAMALAGQELWHNVGDVRYYGDRVTYLTNTGFPEHVERVRPYGPFSTLIVAGHDPHADVLTLFPSNGCRLVGFAGTVYDKYEDKHSLLHRLHTCEHTRARFDRFTFVASLGQQTHSPRWSDFLRVVDSETFTSPSRPPRRAPP